MTALFRVSMFSLLIALIKLGAFIATGSMVVAASMVDSFSDSVLSYINYRMNKLAQESADQQHPFGHGGFEVVSGLIQGAVVIGAGLLVVFESLSRLVLLHESTKLDDSGFTFALLTMLGAALVGLLLHFYLQRQKTSLNSQNKRSLALEADHAHYLSDFFMNMTGAIGLLAVYWWDSFILDGVCGLIGGLLIVRVGIPIGKKSIADILHTRVDPQEQKRYVELALSADPQIIGVHRLRSRQLGPTTFVDFHLKMPKSISLAKAHLIGDKVTAILRSEYPNIDIIIHLDPDDEPDDDLFEPAYDHPLTLQD